MADTRKPKLKMMMRERGYRQPGTRVGEGGEGTYLAGTRPSVTQS